MYQRTQENYEPHYQRGSENSQRSSMDYQRTPENFDMMMVNVKSETSDATDDTMNGSTEAVYLPDAKITVQNGITGDDVSDEVNNVEDEAFISYL